MTTISLVDAQAKLPELLRNLAPGEQLVITEGDRPLATVSAIANKKEPRKLGALKGSVLYMAPDFDEPLEDFKDYM
ncbi:MAG: DUF2281 domain-containing protein [Planctomycetaceae bacterium]|nr:DUF2281 domain-containing protein [Planctomycetaceae bacterium]